MVKPRVFVSSTFYDLKHIRSSLELFIDSLGFEPILSEKGDITYMPDAALEESCYREAGIADIFVLIIGGRYGAEAGPAERGAKKKFYDRYDSITRKEYETADQANIPIFILIDKNVHAEYYTYLMNKDKPVVRYAHVDSVNVFQLIEFIYARRRNNPIFDFDRTMEIETWLKEQWAGMFRELLRTRSQQAQLLALGSQVSELKSIGDTLKNYLEVVLKSVDPEKSEEVIEGEEKRRDDVKRIEKLSPTFIFYMLTDRAKLSPEQAERIVAADSFHNVIELLLKDVTRESSDVRLLVRLLAERGSAARTDLNEARQIVGLEPLNEEEESVKLDDEWKD